MDWKDIVLAIVSTILVPIIAFLITKWRENHKLKKREDMLKELCNYAFGQIDMIIQDSIKVDPEVRESMRKASERYHSLDVVPDKIMEDK